MQFNAVISSVIYDYMFYDNKMSVGKSFMKPYHKLYVVFCELLLTAMCCRLQRSESDIIF